VTARRQIVYDTGVLVGAEAGSQLVGTYHRRALARKAAPLVLAPVLAQAWRSGPQPRLSRLLAGCLVVPMTEDLARRAGVLCGRAGTADVVDASVVALAVLLRASVLTGDAGDIERLVEAVGEGVPVERV
jgi:hypothetical protein